MRCGDASLSQAETYTVRKGAASDISARDRYRLMFDRAPVALWHQDFSKVCAWFDELRGRGITDIRE